MKSLRARLIVGTTSVVAGLLVTAGVVVYASVRRSLTRELDRSLEARARLLASVIEQDGDEIELDFEEIDMSEFAGRGAGGYLQVSRGRVDLYRSPSLGNVSFGESPVRSSWAHTGLGFPVRTFDYRFVPRQDRPESGAEPVELLLVIARDGAALDEALDALAATLLVVGAGTLLLIGATLALVVRWSLRSLDRVGEEIAAIDPRDPLRRVETGGLPTELAPLVERVNDLIVRLRAALDRERAFSGDVAHELRTPLAGLRTTLDVAGSRERTPAEYTAAMFDASSLAARLQGLVDRLLQLARLDTWQTRGEAAPVDATALVLESWEPRAHAASLRGLAVTFDMPETLDVAGDPELLRIVFRNLLDNAVAHADEGGSVGVALTSGSEDRLRLRVSNSGSRISASDAEKALQRFWRGDAARADAGLHCGLGLALVDRAARALGGRLQVRSEVGGEFVVTFRLPA